MWLLSFTQDIKSFIKARVNIDLPLLTIFFSINTRFLNNHVSLLAHYTKTYTANLQPVL